MAFLLIAGFLAVEFLRRPEKGLPTLVALYGAALALSVALRVTDFGGFLSPAVSWTGIVLMLVGLGLRTWSLRVLSPFRVRAGSPEAESAAMEAPYNVLRYPGYLGSILVWLSLGLALTNWSILCGIPALLLWNYAHRIRAEETARLAAFGERYELYQITTWSVVPFFY